MNIQQIRDRRNKLAEAQRIDKRIRARVSTHRSYSAKIKRTVAHRSAELTVLEFALRQHNQMKKLHHAAKGA